MPSEENQKKLKLGFVEESSNNEAYLRDFSFPLNVYLPGSVCPNCGYRVKPGCPELCKKNKSNHRSS